MTLSIANINSPVDQLYPAFETGFVTSIVQAQTITATANSGILQLPYMCVGGKVRLVVNVTAISGTTPTLTVAYQESVDGVTLNPTAAFTSAALSATGVTWVAAATGPVFNTGEFTFTVGGTTPSVTFSAWLVGWNR